MIRTIARGIARRRMKQLGYKRMCKARNQTVSPSKMPILSRMGIMDRVEKRSLFAEKWRKYA